MIQITRKWLKDHDFKESDYWKTITPDLPHYMYHTDKGSIHIQKSAVEGRQWLVDIRSHGDCHRNGTDHINTVEELNEVIEFAKMDKL